MKKFLLLLLCGLLMLTCFACNDSKKPDPDPVPTPPLDPPDNNKGDVVIPVEFDGTSFKDKLGLVELMGYGADGLYTENMKIEIAGSTWYVYDINGKNGGSGAPKQNYQWKGKVDGSLNGVGGHNALQDSGSAFVFTAPEDGSYKFDVSMKSTYFNQTTRKAWSDYIIQKYDGTTYTELVNVNNIDKPDKTATVFDATVELKKGEQVIIIRKPNATAVTHNVSSEGDAKITITALAHNCSADSIVEHIDGIPPFCTSVVDGYYKCYCGALYADAETRTPVGDKAHEWKDGVCTGCSAACKHDVTIEDAGCNRAAICGICGFEVVSSNPNNHTDLDGTYRYIGKGKHQFNRTCCDGTDIVAENCIYGDDNICDKCGSDKTESNNEMRLIGLGVQRPNRTIAVYDIAKGEMNTPIWSYTSTFCQTVSGFKFRNLSPYGDVVLITGGTTTEMVTYDTKEVIWKTSQSPSNAHSVELLPNGIVAVGGSSGNSISFFNINDDDPEVPELTISYTDAHGVLWDPKYEVLWCAGDDMLFAYKVTLNDDGSVSAVKDENLSVTAPDSGLHDLQAYLGHEDILLVTTHKHVYFYNKVNKTFTDVYTDVENASVIEIKSVGFFENGDIFYTEHDGIFDNDKGGWNTTFVNYIDGETRTLSTVATTAGRFYKARIWYSAYQP